MANVINFVFEDREYTLEFTRKAIEQMERQGFLASEISDKPMTSLPALFAGAFIANHRFVKKDLIDRIFENMTQRQELIGKLAEMYNGPIMALMDEPEVNEGNIQWGASR